jgi:aryl-alcohol dehydrogenase-like predicted oxidoreductase
MTLRQLGNSDLNITRMGIGAWAIGGGKWEFAWGPQNDNDSIEAIHAGLDQGSNWIDTAAVYGLGHSETVVGKAIKERREPLRIHPNVVLSGTRMARSCTTCRPLRSAAERKPA